MLQRIVKLTFRQDSAETFLREVFDPSKEAPGCRSMYLLRDKAQPFIMFTYSVWESEEDLEKYRQSPLFQSTWQKTKVLFGGRPEAWSCLLHEGY